MSLKEGEFVDNITAVEGGGLNLMQTNQYINY